MNSFEQQTAIYFRFLNERHVVIYRVFLYFSNTKVQSSKNQIIPWFYLRKKKFFEESTMVKSDFLVFL